MELIRSAVGGKRTFLGALILGLVDELCSEACWFSEASCGWYIRVIEVRGRIRSDESILFNIDSCVMILNK